MPHNSSRQARLAGLFIAIGLALIVAGVAMVARSSVHWWSLVTLGVFVFFGAINSKVGAHSFFYHLHHKNKALVWVCVGYVANGLVVEAIRILPGLWEYAGTYNRPSGVAFFLIVGYPVFLAGMYETYIFFGGVLRSARLGWLAATLFVALWNETFNRLVPLWVINDPYTVPVTVLFLTGYVAETSVAILLARWRLGLARAGV